MPFCKGLLLKCHDFTNSTSLGWKSKSSIVQWKWSLACFSTTCPFKLLGWINLQISVKSLVTSWRFLPESKTTKLPVTGPSFCRIHSVTSSYRESCRLSFGWYLLINFEDQTRTEKTATNAWWFQVGDLLAICPQRKHHQAGETNHLNHWHFGSSLSQSNKSSWWVGASENKY